MLDLGGLAFRDSSGISVLIAARDHALAAGAGIAPAPVPDHVPRRDGVGLAGKCVDSPPDALHSCG